MKLYLCFKCFGVSACSKKDGKDFTKCSECDEYSKELPCEPYSIATLIQKDYECDCCREERISQLN